MEVLKEKDNTPYKPVELHLFVKNNEKRLLEGPLQLISTLNWYIVHPDAPLEGFTRAGTEVDIVVDDLTGRKTQVIFCTKDEL